MDPPAPPPLAAAAALEAPELADEDEDRTLDAPLEKRDVDEARNPPELERAAVLPPPAAEEPEDPVVPAPLSAEATAEVVLLVDDEPPPEEPDELPPPPPPPAEIVTTIPPPRPPPVDTVMPPPPRPPRNCGAMRETYRSATVEPDSRMVRSSVPRVAGAVFTTTGPPPPPPVNGWASSARKTYAAIPPTTRIANNIKDLRGPRRRGSPGEGTTSGRGIGSVLRSGCIWRTLVPGCGSNVHGQLTLRPPAPVMTTNPVQRLCYTSTKDDVRRVRASGIRTRCLSMPY